MAMPLAEFGDGIQKMNVPPSAYRDSALSSAAEFMKMVFVEICPKRYLVNMVVQPDRYHLAAYNRKSMIMGVRIGLGNLNATK